MTTVFVGIAFRVIRRKCRVVDRKVSMNKNCVVSMLVAFVVCGVSIPFCWGMPYLAISERERGLYEIMAQGLENVGKIDLTIEYDLTAYADPRISQRGLIYGAMMTPDLAVPGIARISIASPNPKGIKGSGSVAVLTFNMLGQGQEMITSFSASVTSTQGEPIQVTTKIQEPGLIWGKMPKPDEPPASSASEGAADTGSPPLLPRQNGTSSTSAAVQRGMPTVGTIQSAPQNEEPVILPVPTKNTPDSQGDIPLATEDISRTVIEGPAPGGPGTGTVQGAPPLRDSGNANVFSLFREYRGPKTEQAFIALFLRAPDPGFRQEPPIALSDGVTKIRVFFNTITPPVQSPNFAITGAKLVSLKRDGLQYVLELIPDVGVFEATATVVNQGKVINYPLVVAPLLDARSVPGGKFDEAGFALFLKNAGVGKADLNGDGRQDFRDDYIYTANYLVRVGKK
jgi:hypothetical protein